MYLSANLRQSNQILNPGTLKVKHNVKNDLKIPRTNSKEMIAASCNLWATVFGGGFR